MSPNCIELNSVARSFKRASKKGIFSSKSRYDIHNGLTVALRDVSFSVPENQVLGLLGQNGAGKTTLIRILTGLLPPTNGVVRVFGKIPTIRDKEFLRNICLIAGQRRQLTWDLPATDTFIVLKHLYRIDEREYIDQLGFLTELLDLKDLLCKPVRTLSLGQRMKCEIAASLLHSPSLVFLDEPTIGLDAAARQAVWKFFDEYRKRRSTSIVLTSHYMEDIEAMADRTVLLQGGTVAFDGSLTELRSFAGTGKIVRVHYAHPVELPLEFEVRPLGQLGFDVVVTRDALASTVQRLLTFGQIIDLSVLDMPFREKVTEAA
ncbi:ATP-binding cassette domain-containing protein [Burkholderia sp. GS2Y]|uniref:ATP-binding cassette domain-containing protein n=1 Tax=Burkholderia theae TaxID=3143496 RepID=A0ABU9WBG4_9BURK